MGSAGRRAQFSQQRYHPLPDRAHHHLWPGCLARRSDTPSKSRADPHQGSVAVDADGLRAEEPRRSAEGHPPEINITFFRRSLPIATAHASGAGALRSCWAPRMSWAPTPSCGAPASRSRASGAGRSAKSMKVCRACCATRAGRRASHRCRPRPSSPLSRRPRRKSLPTLRIGARARWPRLSASAIAACNVCGPGPASSRIVRTFKVSNDPNFAEKVVDVVGLYMNPPEGALVLCVDEKSQIQALDRTQPGLPLKKGRAQTMTHDYKRNGTTTLFAALDVKTGQVVGECRARHRAKEFISFLKKIDTAVDKVLDLHLILDNYSTHKTKQVQNWLKRHKRFKLHFIPTSSSWLNLVERFFALITEDAIRRGVFKSVAELEAAIAAYLTNHNAISKPFVWTKSADVILRKVGRARATLTVVTNGHQALESIH